MKKLTALTLIALLTSCATGYQPYTWSGGYKDTKIEENKFQVEYYGNGTTSPQALETYWNQRAQELCPNGFDILQENNGANQANFGTGTSFQHPWKKATIQCKAK